MRSTSQRRQPWPIPYVVPTRGPPRRPRNVTTPTPTATNPDSKVNLTTIRGGSKGKIWAHRRNPALAAPIQQHAFERLRGSKNEGFRPLETGQRSRIGVESRAPADVAIRLCVQSAQRGAAVSDHCNQPATLPELLEKCLRHQLDRSFE